MKKNVIIAIPVGSKPLEQDQARRLILSVLSVWKRMDRNGQIAIFKFFGDPRNLDTLEDLGNAADQRLPITVQEIREGFLPSRFLTSHSRKTSGFYTLAVLRPDILLHSPPKLMPLAEYPYELDERCYAVWETVGPGEWVAGLLSDFHTGRSDTPQIAVWNPGTGDGMLENLPDSSSAPDDSAVILMRNHETGLT